MKKIQALVIVIFLALSGCSFFNHTDESSSDNVESEEAVGEVLDPYYNPYNLTAVTDGEYIYYYDVSGIYKWPLKGGDTQLLVSNEKIHSITLHNSYIYYLVQNDILCSILYKINKCGNDPQIVVTRYDDKSSRIYNRITCMQDTLFIHMDGYFSADITFDEDELILHEATGFPTSRGAYYACEADSAPNIMEVSLALYRIYPKSKNKDYIIDGIKYYANYLITDNYVYFLKEDAVWRSDFNGQNKIKIRDYVLYRLINYDAQWVYGYNAIGNVCCRINQETGEMEEYPNWPYSYSSDPHKFDIINNYLYGDYRGEFIKMNVNGGDIEYAPFH